MLADAGPKCSDEAPQSQFLPDIDWLDETTVAEALAPISGEDKAERAASTASAS